MVRSSSWNFGIFFYWNSEVLTTVDYGSNSISPILTLEMKFDRFSLIEKVALISCLTSAVLCMSETSSVSERDVQNTIEIELYRCRW